MAESYCEKSCAQCAQMQQGICPGCKEGPGKRFQGNCKLALCARDKGHETCGSCTMAIHCGVFAQRDYMPEERRRQMEEEAAKKAGLSRRAAVLGKWLWLLFWMFIPSEIGQLMANDYTQELLPGLYMAGKLIGAACSAVYGVIYLNLGSEECRYTKTGVCVLLTAAGSLVLSVLPANEAWTLLISLPLLAVAFFGHYQQYMAHAAVLSDVDYELSEKMGKALEVVYWLVHWTCLLRVFADISFPDWNAVDAGRRCRHDCGWRNEPRISVPYGKGLPGVLISGIMRPAVM